jgi:hypothetical protein
MLSKIFLKSNAFIVLTLGIAIAIVFTVLNTLLITLRIAIALTFATL